MVGVYSSHPTAPLALHARCPALDAAAFRALDALRLPAMRGSIHVLPRETAHLPFRAVPEPPARTAARLKHFGLSARRYAELRDAVLVAAREPRTLAELGTAVGAPDDVKAVTATMTREGTLARVGADGLRSNLLRYVAVELPAAGADEALA
nr:winged helix DNA-binding domain-containing protein [Actinomycetota bacterium]